MRYGTENLRQLWAPWRCNGRPFVHIRSQGRRFYVADAAREAFEAAHIVAQAHGYVLRAGECGSYDCRKIRNGKGWSLHAYGIAEDWNTSTNPLRSRKKVRGGKTITDMPPGMVADVKAIRSKKSGEKIFRWGGDYRTITDAMHWEIVVSPDELSKGIDWTSVAGAEGKVTKSSEEPSIVTVGRDNPLKQPELQRGAKGPSVKRLQQELNQAGASLDDDGKFGKNTQAAVRKYQAQRKLTVNGIADTATWTALLTDQPEVTDDMWPGRAPSARPSGSGNTTKVQKGEGWSQVAARTLGSGSRANIAKLQELNGGDRTIHPGEELLLPGGSGGGASAGGTRTTRVRKGEGWSQVAARTLGSGSKANIAKLQALNGGDRTIHPDEELVIPD